MSEAASPEVLLFDLGGVLMDFAAFECLNALLDEPLGPSEIRAKWLGSKPVLDFELGRLEPNDFARRFVAEWNLPFSPAGFQTEFESWLRGFYPGIPELLVTLRSRFRLACLSNTNPVHWSKWRIPVLELVDEAYVSFEIGLAKPDSAIFETAVSALGVAAGKILFFDDSEANVEAALGIGLPAALVRGPAELCEVLVSRGLLGAEGRGPCTRHGDDLDRRLGAVPDL